MPVTQHSREDIAARGEAVYDRDIRAKVENEQRGMFLVLDVESGEYEIDASDVIATKRLIAKHPGAVLYDLRIGHRSAYRMGGFSKAP